MQGAVKRFMVITLAGATIAGGAGAAAISAAADPGSQRAKVTTQAEVRHEPETRGRAAEGEVGDDHGREAEARGHEAEGEREVGDDHGHEAENEAENEAGDDRGADANQGPSENSGRGGSDDRHGDNRHGDDRGSDR